MILGGVLLIGLLAAGLADLPRAGRLRWQAESPQDWATEHPAPELTLQAAPVDLPSVFTLELTALNSGPPESAWGVVFESSHQRLIILIDNQGYLSVSEDHLPHWSEFRHIHPNDVNTLYMNVTSGGAATLRISDEIAQLWIIGQDFDPAVSFDLHLRCSLDSDTLVTSGLPPVVEEAL